MKPPDSDRSNAERLQKQFITAAKVYLKKRGFESAQLELRTQKRTTRPALLIPPVTVLSPIWKIYLPRETNRLMSDAVKIH